MKILRGKCTSASSSSDIHRVKVTVDGVCDNLLMDVSNGIYLRTGDEVFVAFEDDFNSPLVLGRCSGQLEIQDLVDTMNNMVDVFNKHQHSENAALKIFFNACTLSTTDPTLAAAASAAFASFNLNDKTLATSTQQTKVKPDDLLY